MMKTTRQNDADVIIIGAGASGLYCAARLAYFGMNVLILEHNNRVGKKLLITGKGRCNVTNNCSSAEIMANIPTNPKFMYSALSECSPQDVMEYFESLGVALKTERGNRVFPQSDKSLDIVNALERDLKKKGVKIICKKARELIVENGVCVGVKTDEGSFFAENIVVATGGKSYPATGSTGDGYKMARAVGHTVTELSPSLVPLVTKESYPVDMMGLSLKNVKLKLYKGDAKKPVYEEMGEMLFTHFGVSGPLVLSASCHIEKASDIEKIGYRLEVDLKPALDFETLDKRIQRDFSEFSTRDFKNSLGKLLPAKMIPVIVMLSGIDGETKVNQITREQRLSLVSLIKAFPMTVKAFRPIEEAIITSGGIRVSEINPKTMKSKIVDKLYFIGEILDVDAYTGGFNLQIAFATANACAQGIVYGL